MKVAIIGAGISGVSAGRLLREKDISSVIFEKQSKAGGLVRCDRVDGALFHRTGGHVFNSRNKEVLDWFWKHFNRETEFIQTRRNAQIYTGGRYIGYPLENYLYQLSPDLIEKITKEILQLYKQGYKDPLSYPDFEQFLLNNFGKTLYEIYFKPYNEKIWKADLSVVAMEWLEGKLPMPDYEKMLVSNIVREEEKNMVHSTFFYPKLGGSQFIIDRLSEGLEIRTNAAVETISYRGAKWFVNEQGPFDSVIYTGDVRQLKTILASNGNPAWDEALEAVTKLRSNGTSNVLCHTDQTSLSWLYLPDTETLAHRIIYTGNFSPTNNGEGRKTCVVEFSGSVAKDIINEQIKSLPGNLTPIAYNVEPNSYVIQYRDTRDKIINVKSQLAPKGFYLSGRFAEWEYYNMDKAIEASMQLVQKLE
jgi:protoporphyrinogen oxidase